MTYLHEKELAEIEYAKIISYSENIDIIDWHRHCDFSRLSNASNREQENCRLYRTNSRHIGYF